MKTLTHNGFVLKYDGVIHPVSRSNQITYECFCLMGGLANERLRKVHYHTHYTYHRIDIR